MEHKQFWFFLGLALVFGLCIELMKHIDLSTSSTPLSKLSITDETGSIRFSDPAEMNRNKHLKATESRARMAPPGATQLIAQMPMPTEEPPQQSQEANKKMADGIDAKNEDPQKDKKKDGDKDGDKSKQKKKKKKKKKKDEDPQKQIAQQPASPQDGSDRSKDSGPDDSSAGGAGGTTLPAATDVSGPLFPFDTNENPQSYEEWERYIMREPDFQRVSSLIKLHQTGVVKDDIFYPLVDEMLDDSRPKMRELAVMAIGATPSSRSFTLLAAVTREETGVTPLKSQAMTYMKSYTKLANLGYLAAVMAPSGDANASFEAVRLLQLAAEMHLKGIQTQGQGQQGQGQGGDPNRNDSQQSPPSHGTATATITRQFESFIGILSSLSQQAPDSNVRQAADQTLRSIQSLLGSQPSSVADRRQ